MALLLTLPLAAGAADAGLTASKTEQPTIKLIVAPSEEAQEVLPARPAEALERKLKELNAAEHKARLLSSRPTAATNAVPAARGPLFAVNGYEVAGNPALPPNSLAPLLARHTGTNLSIEEIVRAASDVQAEYRDKGYPAVSVAIAPAQMTNGIVTLNVFQAAVPQIVVAGRRYAAPPAPSTNQKFAVRAYAVTGDTLLSDETLSDIFNKYMGTNIGVAEILKAASDLQLEYRDRGYPTVNVTVPPQQITNGTVKIRVFEGELADIVVVNNRYFSSNNVMRALPGLRANQLLVGPVFESELDHANANQDRQIYPQIAPGPKENTSSLILDVKDRLPLHGKVEYNNLSSPGTPPERVNFSAAYNNLWQYEHSIGVQYSFSPSDFKSGDQWKFYDQPLVANYSAFYRLPLGNAEPVARAVASSPGNFGYDEATRKFRLPTATGRPDLTVYASRSTIDTGVQTVFEGSVSSEVTQTNAVNLSRRDVQQDITVNNNIGARLALPGPPQDNWQPSITFGVDYKQYESSTFKTNTFIYTTYYQDESGQLHTNVDVVPSAVPPTERAVDYLPLSLHYDIAEHDSLGTTLIGCGLGFNVWYSGSLDQYQQAVGSSKSSGHWIVLTPSVTRDFIFVRNWTLTLHIDGQVANEPLLNNEQYGAGGVNSVRGYREGEVFGDEGWRVSLEQKTPACLIGLVRRNMPLTVRGSIYMDYAEVYLRDPQGRKASTPLWGAGAGAVASVGTYFEARLLFSVPFLDAGSTEADQPRFNFALTGQF